MTTYDLPDELKVVTDGHVCTVLLNRPAELNAVNQPLHRRWPTSGDRSLRTEAA